MKFNKLITLAAVASLLWSCQKEETDTNPGSLPNESSQNSEIKSLMGSDVPVVKQKDGSYLVGGIGSDMMAFESNFDDPNTLSIIEPELPGRSALTISGRVRKWPNNTVIYRIGNLTAEMRTNFQRAIDEWESKTAVRFKERTNESFYVNVERTGDNCFCGVANLGVVGSRGILRFGSRAPLSVIIHEIGHTLGFIHEQNRADRDESVIINFENIEPDARDQFFKAENSTPLTSELDLNSIMMYGSFTFSANRRPTIVDLQGNTLPRNSGRLSAGDVAGTNQAYPPADTTGGDGGNDGGNTGGEVTNPATPKSICEGVSAYNRNTRYVVGDKVTFRGFLYERDFSRWNLLGSCDEVQSNDICAGVSEYNSNRVYQVGNKVTFRGRLYRRVANGWINEGQCGA